MFTDKGAKAFVLLSISLITTQATIARDPLDTCQRVYSPKLFRDRASIKNPYFKTSFKSSDEVKYALNFDRVRQYVESLPNTYPNEVLLKKIGHYDGESIYRLDLPGWGKEEKKKIILSAGLHGNESAGVVTLINFIERNIFNQKIREAYDITIVPYLNPGGLKRNARRLNNDVDGNRTFKRGKEEGITKIIQSEFQGETFWRAWDLHEAPLKNKFFVIKNNEDDGGLTARVLSNVGNKHLIVSENGLYPGDVLKSKPPKQDLTRPARIEKVKLKNSRKKAKKDGGSNKHSSEKKTDKNSREYKNKQRLPPENKNKTYTLLGPGEISSDNKGTLKTYYADGLRTEQAYTLEAPGQFPLDEKIEIYTEIMEAYLLDPL